MAAFPARERIGLSVHDGQMEGAGFSLVGLPPVVVWRMRMFEEMAKAMMPNELTALSASDNRLYVNRGVHHGGC